MAGGQIMGIGAHMKVNRLRKARVPQHMAVLCLLLLWQRTWQQTDVIQP
jgi:hypothetical protein